MYALRKKRIKIFITVIKIVLIIGFLASFTRNINPTSVDASERSFSPRFQTNLRGDVQMIGNTLLSCSTTESDCSDARNRQSVKENNQFSMRFVDIDSSSTTYNSSSANLTLPSNSVVVWAGLYWSAEIEFCPATYCDSSKYDEILFRTPAMSSYTTVRDNSVDIDGDNYSGFSEVTDLVIAGGDGTYFTGNLQAQRGIGGAGGWALVIVFQNQSYTLKNVNIYDGFEHVSTGGVHTVTARDFLTPASGTVNANFGFISHEGDYGLENDGITINGRTLSSGNNPSNNIQNSSITQNGANFTARNPNYLNTLGVDIDTYPINGFISNNATTAAMRFEVDSDIVSLHAVMLAIDIVSQATASVECSTPDSFVFNIQSRSNLSESIIKNRVFMLPKGTPGAIFDSSSSSQTEVNNLIDKTIHARYENISGTYTGLSHYNYSTSSWVRSNAPYIVGSNNKVDRSSSTVPTLAATDKYFINSNSYLAGTSANWSFNVKLNPSNIFYNEFYTKGFDVYVFLNDFEIMHMSSLPLIPQRDCTGLFYTTSGGDFRSYEPGGFNQFTYDSSKFWHIQNIDKTTLDGVDFKQKSNPSYVGTSQTGLSDFIYDVKSGTYPCKTRTVNDFCNVTSANNSPHSAMFVAMEDAVEIAVQSGKILKTGVTSPNTSFVQSGFYDSTLKTLNLDRVVTTMPVLIDIETTITELTIIETNGITTNSENIFIRCQSSPCTLKIRSTHALSSDITVGSNQRVTYNKSEVSLAYNKKSRVYLNYDKNQLDTSTTVNNSRKVVLEASDVTKVNYYQATIFTSGLLYTSTSSKTDIIKGSVLSKGISIRTQDLTSDSVYFQAGQNSPFLNIDYDPKQIYIFTNILGNWSSYRTIQRVGF